MEVSYHVARANAKYPNQVKLEQMKLKFDTPAASGTRKQMSVEQATAMAKARWGMFLAPYRGKKSGPPAVPATPPSRERPGHQ